MRLPTCNMETPRIVNRIKKPTNLTLDPILVETAKEWCRGRSKSVSDLVNDMLADHLSRQKKAAGNLIGLPMVRA